MTADDRTVQVPVSLIKMAVHYLGRGGFRALTGQLQDALLSQPPVSLPTREQIAEVVAEAWRKDGYNADRIADAVLALLQDGGDDTHAVQVPVSLIERMKRHMEREQLELLDETVEEVVALLSQPTPTAEHVEDWTDAQPNEGPGCTCGFNGSFEDCAARRAAEAEPTHIEDMAPGTRFVGRHVDPEECGGIDHAWFVIRPGARPIVVSDEGQHWSVDSIDPSTIRDVTPPAVTQ